MEVGGKHKETFVVGGLTMEENNEKVKRKVNLGQVPELVVSEKKTSRMGLQRSQDETGSRLRAVSPVVSGHRGTGDEWEEERAMLRQRRRSNTLDGIAPTRSVLISSGHNEVHTFARDGPPLNGSQNVKAGKEKEKRKVVSKSGRRSISPRMISQSMDAPPSSFQRVQTMGGRRDEKKPRPYSTASATKIDVVFSTKKEEKEEKPSPKVGFALVESRRRSGGPVPERTLVSQRYNRRTLLAGVKESTADEVQSVFDEIHRMDALVEEDSQTYKELEAKMREIKLVMNAKKSKARALRWQMVACRGSQDSYLLRRNTLRDVVMEAKNWDSTEYSELNKKFSVVHDALFVYLSHSTVESNNLVSGDATIADLVQCVTKLHAYSFNMAVVAPLFDAHPTVKVNGFRSLLIIVDCGLDKLIGVLKGGSSKKVTIPEDLWHWLRTFVEIMGHVEGQMIDTSPNCIFPFVPDESRLDDLMAIDTQCFYGQYFGIQYKDNYLLRSLLHKLLVAMSSYGDGYDGEHEPSKVLALFTSTKYLFWVSNERLASKIVELFNCGDIAFLKSFWNLQETVAFVELDNSLRTPSVAVNFVFNIENQAIQLPSRSADGDSLEDSWTTIPASPYFEKIQVRMLSYNRYKGQCKGQEGSKILKSESDWGKSLPSKELLVHIHGGGFIAQTSKAHMNYLRYYARQLDVPIISLDYDLAPGARFPTQVYQAFFLYCWALQNASLLGSSARRVVLTGDSAGGNLVLAVTTLAIRHNIRIPDAIVPVYPVSLGALIPSPARFLGGMDPLLHVAVLMQCFKSYVGDWEDVYDPLLSALCNPAEVLQQFPETHLLVGTMDVLLDDCIEMARTLMNHGRTVYLQCFDLLPHGFLGFNNVVPACTSATQRCILHLKCALRVDSDWKEVLTPINRAIEDIQCDGLDSTLDI